MNIGITIHIGAENESLYTNGIKQNAIFLLNVFKKIGYNAYLINSSDIKAPYDDKVVWDTNEIPIKDWAVCAKETDILFLLGATYPDKELELFKTLGPNKKVIKYTCGNNYIMDMEAVMFSLDERTVGYNQNIDEVWTIPQHEKTCKEYFRIMHNLPADKVKIVPFVWDPMFIDEMSEKFKTTNDNLGAAKLPIYVSGKANAEKQLATFEPNLNIVKWSIIPTMIAEDYFNNGGDFKKLNVFSGVKTLKSEYYQSMIKNMNIFMKDPMRISYLPRISVVTALAKGADVVLAHQWENFLNYSYLDALYLNFPLVHNSPYIQDAGYYYPDFNVAKGQRQLKLAMEQHDNNIDSYNEKSEDVLTRYTVYNDNLVLTYKKLLENLITPNSHKLTHQYNWKTNTYL